MNSLKIKALRVDLLIISYQSLNVNSKCLTEFQNNHNMGSLKKSVKKNINNNSQMFFILVSQTKDILLFIVKILFNCKN